VQHLSTHIYADGRDKKQREETKYNKEMAL
jgi:hypothetical protein